MITALRDCDREAEHFRTPEAAIKPLLPFLTKNQIIWECTDWTHESGITLGLEKEGFTVERASFDFLKNDCYEGWDVIVTNPPYPAKDAFIEKCISYRKPWAMLMPLTALESQKRYRLWNAIQTDNFGLIVPSKRYEFTGGGVWFSTAWFTQYLFTGIRFYDNSED